MLRVNYLIFLTIYSLGDAAFPDGNMLNNNKNFNINKMIVLLLQGGTIYNNEDKHDLKYVSPEMIHANLYAYYDPGPLPAPIGKYKIFLKSHNKKDKFDLEHEIGVIEYKGEVKKWVVDKNENWARMYRDGNMSSFEIDTRFIATQDSKTYPRDAETYSNKFRFVVYFKTQEEDLDIEYEDPNLYDNMPDEYCTQWVRTTGSKRTAGAICPIDPETQKRMNSCLNWRRADLIGDRCYNRLSIRERDDTITRFCNENTNAQDCKCVNRHLQNDYKQNKPYNANGHDYCWYQACNSGDYLIRSMNSIVECPKCVVNLEINSKQAVLRDNYIKCVEEAKSSDDKKKCLQELAREIIYPQQHLIYSYT